MEKNPLKRTIIKITATAVKVVIITHLSNNYTWNYNWFILLPGNINHTLMGGKTYFVSAGFFSTVKSSFTLVVHFTDSLLIT